MGTTVRIVCMWQYGNYMNMLDTLLWAQTNFSAPVKQFIWGKEQREDERRLRG
jgi:hypothetical protein